MDVGTVRVRTAVVDRHRYRATKRSRAGEFASVVIEDTGPGVRAEQKAQIFQPFFSGRVRGMGLGLSIVKGIVDAHGGEVFEAGDEGVGAKFVILLPIPRKGEDPGA
jgi:signal transduction histidine kinase